MTTIREIMDKASDMANAVLSEAKNLAQGHYPGNDESDERCRDSYVIGYLHARLESEMVHRMRLARDVAQSRDMIYSGVERAGVAINRIARACDVPLS
jgi:hypothetical protein